MSLCSPQYMKYSLILEEKKYNLSGKDSQGWSQLQFLGALLQSFGDLVEQLLATYTVS